MESRSFIDLNSNNKHICKKREIKWLQSKNSALIEVISKDGGLYSVETASKIYNSGFVNDLFSKFKEQNNSHILEINRIDVDQNILYISITEMAGYYPPITFFITLRDFMSRIGGKVYIDKDFIFGDSELLANSKIIPNLYNLLSICVDLLEKTISFISFFNSDTKPKKLLGERFDVYVMSTGNVERILKKYADIIRPNHPELPGHVYPHMIRKRQTIRLVC